MTRPLLALVFLLAALPLAAEKISPGVLATVLGVGDEAGVPQSVTMALMWEESEGNASARSPLTREGYRSRGLFQLYEKPSNLGWLLSQYYEGDPEYFDILCPICNATVALRYLAALHRQFGTWERALWFYNCGRVTDPPAETLAYAMRIINAH